MRPFGVLPAVAGAALFGIALAVGTPASADAIEDSWPYGGSTGPSNWPGVQGTPTNTEDFLGIFTTGDVVYSHFGDEAPWYEASQYMAQVPWIFQAAGFTVTDVLDTSDGYPSVGTTFDTFGTFMVPDPFSGMVPVPFWQTATLDDPEVGTLTYWTLGSGDEIMRNMLLSTDVGMKDVLTIFGQEFVLFDTSDDAVGGSAAADLGFDQLLHELFLMAPDMGGLAGD